MINSSEYEKIKKEVMGLISSARKTDFISGSIWDKILKFSLPLAATGILQQLFNAADIAVVGQFSGGKGSAAMAAVGANTPVISLIINSFIGIALGTNVVISNAVGSKDERSVSKAVHTSVILSVIIGIFITALGEVFAEPILSSQDVPDEVLPLAVQYFRIYVAGVPVILLYNFEAAIFRGTGNTTFPLAVLMLSGVLNVGFNLLFVLVLGMTVDGVALATVISNAISGGLLFIRLLRSEGATKLRLKDLRIDKSALRKILLIGVPAGLQSAVFSTANILIQRSINKLGTTVMAGSSASLNIEMFAYTVLNSFGQACTTFTGQNYGAGRIDRCKRSLLLSYLEGLAATAISVVVILVFGRQLLSVFNPDPEVIEAGYLRMTIIFKAYVFSLTYEVISGYLRGFGISALPALLTTLGVCGVRITWIYAIFPLYESFDCIMTVYPISLGATAVMLAGALLILRPAKKRGRELKVENG